MKLLVVLLLSLFALAADQRPPDDGKPWVTIHIVNEHPLPPHGTYIDIHVQMPDGSLATLECGTGPFHKCEYLHGGLDYDAHVNNGTVLVYIPRYKHPPSYNPSGVQTSRGEISWERVKYRIVSAEPR